jgi:triacylglycerol esterase/lipase EstA (alpha/beta hydrolase family)
MLVASAAVQAGECVVLLHGLARTANSMSTMQDALIEDGYEVVNVDYPSRDLPIEELAPMAVEEGLSGCRSKTDVENIHFVTHSHAFMMRMQTPIELTIRFLRTGSFSPEKI